VIWCVISRAFGVQVGLTLKSRANATRAKSLRCGNISDKEIAASSSVAWSQRRFEPAVVTRHFRRSLPACSARDFHLLAGPTFLVREIYNPITRRIRSNPTSRVRLRAARGAGVTILLLNSSIESLTSSRNILPPRFVFSR